MSRHRLFSVQLQPSHEPTGGTVHWRNGALLPPPVSLEIVCDDSGIFLYYLDETGSPQTDSWHETLDDAFEQARHEFGVAREDWNSA